MSIVTAIELATGGSMIDGSATGKVFWFGPFFVVLVASYFLLIGNGRHKQIAKELSSETSSQKKTRLLALWLHVIGTFVVFFGLISISRS